MKFDVNRSEFLLMASKTARAALYNNPATILEGIHIKANDRTSTVQMTATNLQVAVRITIPADVSENGEAVLDSKLLVSIFEQLPEDEVSMNLVNGAVLITSGSSVFQVAVTPGEFPQVSIPIPGDTVTVSGIKTLAAKTVFAAKRPEDTPQAMNCVNLILDENGMSATAMDGLCLANTEGDKDSKGKASMLVPASALKLLASISHDSDVYELGITGKDGKNIVFYDGTLLFSARLMDGRMIEAQKVFDNFNPHSLVKVKAAELKNGLSCMETISSGGRVGIRLVADGIELQSLDENKPGGVVITASVSKPMDRTFFLEISHLVNCLRQLSGEVAVNFSADGNLVITDGSMKYFQAGMRAPRKAADKAGASKSNIAA